MKAWPLVLLGLVMANACAVWLLAHPYRLFPADDQGYLQALRGIEGQPLTHLAQRQNPVYWLYLQGCYQLWRLVSSQDQDIFLVANLAANTIGLLALTRITHQLTGNLRWALMTGLLYVTSAWTTTYYLFFSYTPLPTALMLVALSLMLTGCQCPPDAKRPGLLWTGAAGTVLGVAFWCAPSATLLTALLLPLPLLLTGTPFVRHRLPLTLAQAGGFIVSFLPWAFLCFRAYGNHIVGNITTYHYDDAVAKFSSVPKPPALSFWRIMGEYSGLQTTLFLVLIPLLSVALFFKNRSLISGAEEAKPFQLRPLRVCLILLVVCLVHAGVVDLLPTTKLARTHFHIFPLTLIFLVVTPYHLAKGFTSERIRRPLTMAYGGVLMLSILLSSLQSLESRSARFRLPEFLDRQQGLEHLYLLKEDPHAKYIAQWLQESRVTTIGLAMVGPLLRKGSPPGHKNALIIGPTGPGSGNSILRHGTLPDFDLELPQSITDRQLLIPYYSFHPPFLWEEEICQALYFAGGLPDPTAAESQIKILIW